MYKKIDKKFRKQNNKFKCADWGSIFALLIAYVLFLITKIYNCGFEFVYAYVPIVITALTSLGCLTVRKKQEVVNVSKFVEENCNKEDDEVRDIDALKKGRSIDLNAKRLKVKIGLLRTSYAFIILFFALVIFYYLKLRIC
jgi:uncharacterized protein YacL